MGTVPIWMAKRNGDSPCLDARVLQRTETPETTTPSSHSTAVAATYPPFECLYSRIICNNECLQTLFTRRIFYHSEPKSICQSQQPYQTAFFGAIRPRLKLVAGARGATSKPSDSCINAAPLLSARRLPRLYKSPVNPSASALLSHRLP